MPIHINDIYEAILSVYNTDTPNGELDLRLEMDWDIDHIEHAIDTLEL